MNAWAEINEELDTYFPSTGRVLNFPVAVILALACQTADASEPQFTTDPIPPVPMGDPVVQSGTVPGDQEVTPPSGAAEPLCNYIEITSCALLSRYLSETENPNCLEGSPCERAACYVTGAGGESLNCFQTVCPSSYPNKYVECLRDLLSDEVECIRQQESCEEDPINLQFKCRLPSSKRHAYLLDCMQ